MKNQDGFLIIILSLKPTCKHRFEVEKTYIT